MFAIFLFQSWHLEHVEILKRADRIINFRFTTTQKFMQTQYKRLTNPQWEIMKEYLPIQRKRKYDLRAIVDAILWYLRLGGQWRNLPDSYPPYAIVYYYFKETEILCFQSSYLFALSV